MPGGRKPKQYNEDCARQVRALSQYGVPQEDIAATIGVCVETMVKLYRKEFNEGRAIANANIGRRLYDKAMEGDTSALIFWAKARMKWRTEDKRDAADEEEIAPIAIRVQIVNGKRDG